MKKYDDIEKLKFVLSTLVNGLNAVSLSLDDYLFFEDIIFNEHFDLALDFINSKSTISSNDKIALTYIFEHAFNDYRSSI